MNLDKLFEKFKGNEMDGDLVFYDDNKIEFQKILYFSILLSETSKELQTRSLEEVEGLSYQIKAQEALINHLKTELAKFTSNKVTENQNDDTYRNLTLDLWN